MRLFFRSDFLPEKSKLLNKNRWAVALGHTKLMWKIWFGWENGLDGFTKSITLYDT